MARRVIYEGRLVHLGLEDVTLPDGRQVTLEVIRHKGASAVVPLHDDGSVTLVHQYRHAGGGMHYEVPAGLIEDGEVPEASARRELGEEAGLAALHLEPLGFIYTTPGFTDERIFLFLATGLGPGEGQLDDDEYLSTVRMPLSDALQMVRDGRITDAKTIVALYRTADQTRPG